MKDMIQMLRMWVGLLMLCLFMACGVGCSKSVDNSAVRIGYFPNISHAQVVVGIAEGTFAAYLGPKVTIKTTLFNAGPSLIEAVFSGDIDIACVGPSPAINGYVRSGGKALKVIAGVASGGSLFVVRKDSHIKEATDLAGKRIATPQLGNTQDIAFRGYIKNFGLKPKEKGGTIDILPLRNPDILNLFMRKQIDGAWVPEPWGSRIIRQADGKVFLDERDLWKEGRFSSTLMIVRTDFLKNHPDYVKRWLAAHVKITRWIHQHSRKARKIIGEEIKALSGVSLPEEVMNDAFSTLEATYDPIVPSLVSYAEMAYNAGFLGRQKFDISGLIDLELLNEVLKERSLPQVSEEYRM
jgi:NitT/TauT family transport system substrate-binding protein